jgi:hypothetical protein
MIRGCLNLVGEAEALISVAGSGVLVGVLAVVCLGFIYVLLKIIAYGDLS